MLRFLKELFGGGGREYGDAGVAPPSPPDPHPPAPSTHEASETMRQQEQWLDHIASTDAEHQAIAAAAQTRHDP